jgi:Domain of unknown function (DUF4157)
MTKPKRSVDLARGDTMSPDDTYPEMAGEQGDINGEAGTRAFLALSFPTLGKRLTREARRIVSRRIPTFPWLRPLATAMERVASLPVPARERFRRIEVLPSRSDNPSWLSPDLVWVRQQPQVLLPRRLMEGQPLPPASQPPLSDNPWQLSPMEGQPLSPHLRQQLQNFVGHGTESLRIHNDEAAHDFAQAQRADAVTVGRHIFFRQDRFRPQEDEGFALLTHEALHVVRAMRPDSAWRRATLFGIQEEEQEAANIESRALAARRNASLVAAPSLLSPRPLLQAQTPVAPGRPEGLPSQRMAGPAAAMVSAESTASALAQRPMRAPTDRTLENGPMSAPTTPDMDELKRALYRDLMKQIKADLERGG